jgi:hypothetical protein
MYIGVEGVWKEVLDYLGMNMTAVVWVVEVVRVVTVIKVVEIGYNKDNVVSVSG